MRWQMSLYKEMAGKAEDADDPEKVVKRVQEVSAVLYHIEVVSRLKHRDGQVPGSVRVRRDVSLVPLSDGASLQVQENGLAQAAVQAAAQGGGGLLQDDAALQHPHVNRT